MPPNTSFSREKLIDAAFKIVRAKGRDKLTARAIAAELHSSTMPVYSYLKSMKKIDADLEKKTIELLLQYQTTPRTGDRFYDIGLGYVMFARNEKKLFRFMLGDRGSSRGQANTATGIRTMAFKTLVSQMKKDPGLSGVDETRLESMLTKMWIFTHGLAVLASGNALPQNDQAYFEVMLHDVGRVVIEGELNDLKVESGGPK